MATDGESGKSVSDKCRTDMIQLDLIADTSLADDVVLFPKVQPIMRELHLNLVEDAAGLDALLPLCMGWYTVQSAANILGLHRTTVYQHLASKNLEGMRVFDSCGELINVLVSKKSVEEYDAWRKAKAALPRPSYG